MQESKHWRVTVSQPQAPVDLDGPDGIESVATDDPIDVGSSNRLEIRFEARPDVAVGSPSGVLVSLDGIGDARRLSKDGGVSEIRRVSPSQWLIMPDQTDGNGQPTTKMLVAVETLLAIDKDDLDGLLLGTVDTLEVNAGDIPEYDPLAHWLEVKAKLNESPESGHSGHPRARNFFHALDILTVLSQFKLELPGSRGRLEQALLHGKYGDVHLLAPRLEALGASGVQDMQKALETTRRQRRKHKIPTRPSEGIEREMVGFGSLIAKLAMQHFGETEVKLEIADQRLSAARPLGWGFMRFALGELRRRHGVFKSEFDGVHNEGAVLDDQRWGDLQMHYESEDPDTRQILEKSQFNIEPNGDLYECFAEFAALLATSEIDGFKNTLEQEIWIYLYPVIVGSLELFFERYAARPMQGVRFFSMSPLTRVMVSKGMEGEPSPTNEFLNELIAFHRAAMGKNLLRQHWQNALSHGRRYKRKSVINMEFKPFSTP